MSALSPLFAVLLPFVSALVVAFVGPRRDEGVHLTDGADIAHAERARWAALIGLGLALTVLLAGSASATSSGPVLAFPLGAWEASLRIDGPAAVLGSSYLLAGLLAVAGAPRRSLTRSAAVALVTLGAGLLVTLAGDVLTLSLGWLLGLSAPLHVARRPVRGGRVIVGFAIARVVFLCAGVACGLAGALDRGEANPVSIEAVVSPQGTFALATLILVTLAGLARMAVFPFHLWLVPFADAAPSLLFAVAFGANVGLVALLRLALPLAAALDADAFPFVEIVGLVAALHAGLRALSEPRLRRLVALVIGSQLGIVVVGVSALGEQAASGAMVNAAAVAIGATGLLVLVNAVEARVGAITLDARSPIGGLAEAMPRASLAWFVVALATVAIPGSLGFVGEDLVLHGLLTTRPFAAILMLLTTVVNAVTLLRAGVHLFLGPARRKYAVPDLLGRERLTLALLFLFLVGYGLFPSRLVDVASHAARELIGIAATRWPHRTSSLRCPDALAPPCRDEA